MRFLRKMESKFGRYAIKDLSVIIIAFYAAGYILDLIAPDILNYLTLEPYYILRGQVWRLVSWVIVPPGKLGLFTVIMLFFYLSIGRTLEKTWGSFFFNVYIFMGILFTAIGSLLLYGFYVSRGYHYLFGGLFSTYYINMSIFLAFAVSYPDMEVLLYFFIPIKMKWMGMLYLVLTAYSFMNSSLPGRVSITASLLNFAVFYLMTKKNPKQAFRRAAYQKKAKSTQPKMGQPMHRCTVCGRTEMDSDQLVFRYCSKCEGAHEYCQEHLFTHTHIHM